MGWKLGTILFGLATLVLLAREATRPGPLVSPDQSPAARTTGEPESVAPSIDDPIDAEESAPDAEPKMSSRKPSRSEPDPVWLTEGPRALVARLIPRLVDNVEYRVPWKALQKALEARREEVLPILSDWVGRLDEIARNGGYHKRLTSIYAALAGRDGVARLEALARGRRWTNYYIGALTTIRDPAAIEALRRIQETAPPNVGMFHLGDIAGQEAGLALIREWAVLPPTNQEHLRAAANRVLFYRSDADREAVWARATPDERVRLTRSLGRLGKNPIWPERARAAAVAGLRSTDAFIRLLSVRRIVGDPDAYDETAIEDMERVLAEGAATEATDGPEAAARKSFEELVGWRERRAKRTEAEKAYAAFVAGL
jgi:hypothetical protein